MSKRKEKVAKRIKQRESVIDTDYGSTHSENGRVLDAPVITADALKPVVDKAHVMNTVDEPKPVPRRPARLPDVEQIKTPELATTSMSVPAPKGVYSTERVTPTQLMGKAEIKNPTGIVNPTIEAAKKANKVPTLSELLAEQRKTAIKDKTDAAKMQKYYALTDAFSALGKMGGAAIGGAIGGNMLDSAPIVADYQPSRGYIDAFEKAKQANDRIRALDEKVFNLAARDEERVYNDKVRAADRKYQEEQNKLNREFQAEQNRLTREWNKAVADGNREAQARIERELIVLKHQNDMAMQRLKNKGALDEKTAGQAYSKWQADMYNTTPIRFSDGTTIKIPDNYYEAIRRSLINTKVNDKAITKDNVDSFIVNNPALINQYLADWGFSTSSAPTTTTETKSENSSDVKPTVDTSFPQHISQIPIENMVAPKPITQKEAASTETDLTKKWESSEI
jgi:hypothetical protein